MPGYKVFLQDSGGIHEGFTCSYCKLLLKDPVQTSETGQRLCKECFEEASKLVYELYIFLNTKSGSSFSHIQQPIQPLNIRIH